MRGRVYVAFSPQKDSASLESSAWNCLSGSRLRSSWASAHHPIASQTPSGLALSIHPLPREQSPDAPGKGCALV